MVERVRQGDPARHGGVLVRERPSGRHLGTGVDHRRTSSSQRSTAVDHSAYAASNSAAPSGASAVSGRSGISTWVTPRRSSSRFRKVISTSVPPVDPPPEGDGPGQGRTYLTMYPQYTH